MSKLAPDSSKVSASSAANMFLRLFEHKLIRYIFVGGSAYIIEMLVLYVFRYILNLSPLSSVAISFWVGFFIAFILQKIVTFKNYKRDIKTVTKQLVGYSALVAFNYTFTLVVVGAFHTSLNVIILRTITIAVITLWNFIIYRKLFSDSSNG